MSGTSGANRLSPQQVISARERRAAGEKVADIARSLGVTDSCISLVTTGKSHKRIGGPITPATRARAASNKTATLHEELVALRPNAAPAVVDN